MKDLKLREQEAMEAAWSEMHTYDRATCWRSGDMYAETFVGGWLAAKEFYEDQSFNQDDPKPQHS